MVTDLVYLIAAVLFILGLKQLSSPATARSGNLLGAVGMLLAVAVTLLDRRIVRFEAIVAGLVSGGLIGVALAWFVRMTAMPQMVALLNGLGGGASLLVAWGEFLRPGLKTPDLAAAIMASVLVGGATLSGSLVAFAKLQELLPGRPVTYPAQNALNGLLLLTALALSIALTLGLAPVQPLPFFYLLLGLAMLVGIGFVIPIGGADMPVVISFLNACSGVAAACVGFVLYNNMLIIAGALVGASGLILTGLMCRAMNRSLANVFFSAFGQAASGRTVPGGPAGGRQVQEATAEDVAVLMAYSRSVVVVPGYGMAVAQAQHAVREMADLLQAKGVEVKYAIHPVAGRMPGHMNVLLAEANVPYEMLYEMDRINPEFENTDVALVIGANDVTNPAARNERASPLYGMPILNVDQARHIILLKRSLRPGFAGVENPLFYNRKTRLLFADAKAGVAQITGALKGL